MYKYQHNQMIFQLEFNQYHKLILLSIYSRIYIYLIYWSLGLFHHEGSPLDEKGCLFIWKGCDRVCILFFMRKEVFFRGRVFLGGWRAKLSAGNLLGRWVSCIWNGLRMFCRNFWGPAGGGNIRGKRTLRFLFPTCQTAFFLRNTLQFYTS